MKLAYTRLKTQDGTIYETEAQNCTEEDLQEIRNLIKMAVKDELNHLSLETSEGDVYFPSEVLKTSVISLIIVE